MAVAFFYSPSSHLWKVLDLFIYSDKAVQIATNITIIIQISSQISVLNGCKSNNVLIPGI